MTHFLTFFMLQNLHGAQEKIPRYSASKPVRNDKCNFLCDGILYEFCGQYTMINLRL